MLRDENKKLKGLMALEKQTSNESLIAKWATHEHRHEDG
jgi:hypothetical protein